MGYLVDNPVGKIKVIIMDRVADMEDWVAHLMPELPSRMLHPLLCVIILFFLDWRIGLSIFVPVPIALIGMITMMYKYRSRMAVWLSSYANVADRSAEYVHGIPVIKAFAQDKASYGKFADAIKFYHFSTMKWWKQSWFGKALMTVAMMTPQLASMPLAFYLYDRNQISIETLLLALILPIAILPQAFGIIMSFELFQMDSNTWVSIQELLDMPVQKRPDEKNKAVIDNSKGIEFDNISFSYHDGTEVLHNISFKTKPGEVTAIVGPSGGGKSTIAKLLAGFWDQSSGRISMGGVDTKNISFKQLAEEISFVSQDNFLFDVSIRDNIRIGKPDATEDEIIAAAKAAHCHEFISKLPDGYNTKAGEAGGTMSGGERQRITLARAILKPASTIILDEATAYADPENEALIQEAISNLVIVAHRLNTIKQANQIILIDRGKIKANGKHDRLSQLHFEVVFVIYCRIFSTVINLSSLLVTLFSCYLYTKGEVLLPQALTVSAAGFMIFGGLKQLENASILIVKNPANMKYLDEVLDIPKISDGTLEVMENQDIVFYKVSFSYDKRNPVLKDLSFTIAQGSKTAIVGTSGSGKTTIINLIFRFYDV